MMMMTMMMMMMLIVMVNMVTDNVQAHTHLHCVALARAHKGGPGHTHSLPLSCGVQKGLKLLILPFVILHRVGIVSLASAITAAGNKTNAAAAAQRNKSIIWHCIAPIWPGACMSDRHP